MKSRAVAVLLLWVLLDILVLLKTGNAKVYDFLNLGSNDFSVLFKAVKKGELCFRINGKRCVVEFYDTDREPGDIIGYYLNKARKNGSLVTAPKKISLINAVLLNDAGADHACYETAEEYIVVAASEKNKQTEVVCARIDKKDKGRSVKLFHGDIKSLFGIRKESEIEIIESGKVVHCFAAYTVPGLDKKRAAESFIKDMELSGWKVVKKPQKEGNIYLLRKDGAERVVLIEDEGEGLRIGILG